MSPYAYQVAAYNIHQSVITLEPWTVEVNNADFLVTLALVDGWDIEVASEHFVLQSDMLAARKMGKHTDLSNWAKL